MKHDEPLHHADDTHIDSQLLRDECGYTFRRFSTCVRIHYFAIGNLIGGDLYMVQKD